MEKWKSIEEQEQDQTQIRHLFAVGIYYWLQDIGYGKKAIRDVFNYSENQMKAVLDGREIPSPAGMDNLTQFVKNTVYLSLQEEQYRERGKLKTYGSHSDQLRQREIRYVSALRDFFKVLPRKLGERIDQFIARAIRSGYSMHPVFIKALVKLSEEHRNGFPVFSQK